MTLFSRKWIVGIVLILIALLVLFNAGSLFDKTVKKTLSVAMKHFNAKNKTVLGIDGVDVSLKNGSILLNEISFVPDSVYYRDFKNGNVAKKLLTEIHISDIELKNLSMTSVFWKGRIDSAQISVNDVSINIYLNTQNKSVKHNPQKPSGAFDSLYLKGLHHVDFGPIQVNNYQVNVLDAQTKDTISSFSGEHLELDGVDLEERQGVSHVFDLQTDHLKIALKNQRLKLPKNEFDMTLGALEFSNSDQELQIKDFSFKPVKSLEHLAANRKFADNLTDVQIKNLNLNGLNINTYRESHLASVEKVQIDGMHLNLFKNKQKPENLSKRPLLPHQILKKLEVPIHIGEIAIENSSLTYKEIQPANAKDVVVINLTDLNARVKYVTSIKDSLTAGVPLSISLKSKLLNAAHVELDVKMPYHHKDNAFTYVGRIGAANLARFNSILLPAAYLKIENGHLEGIQFSYQATPSHSEGEFIMRYSELQVDIPLKHKTTEHALSFFANSAIHTSNPKRNGKLRVTHVEYERIPYKGLGGNIIKSVLNGVKSTIVPFEATLEKKKERKLEKKLKKEIKREKKEEKKMEKEKKS